MCLHKRDYLSFAENDKETEGTTVWDGWINVHEWGKWWGARTSVQSKREKEKVRGEWEQYRNVFFLSLGVCWETIGSLFTFPSEFATVWTNNSVAHNGRSRILYYVR